jgi:hypothetical protein
MRSSILVVVFGLAGCATVPSSRTAPAVCVAGVSEKFVGQPGTIERGAAIRAATHASTLRWATPGMMMTMEFNASRVTVRLGPDGKIVAVNCG